MWFDSCPNLDPGPLPSFTRRPFDQHTSHVCTRCFGDGASALFPMLRRCLSSRPDSVHTNTDIIAGFQTSRDARASAPLH